jgi:hypothetical protein
VAVNVGILVVGVVGGAIVGIGLGRQERNRVRRWHVLTTEGVAATGTVTEVTATGRFSAFRRVTVAVDGGGSFLQTMDRAEADRFGLAVGQRVGVWHRAGDPSDAVLDLAPPAPRRVPVPVVAGVVIAVLGLAAAAVT